jgi:flagellar basal-body rod protein FlgB
MFSPVDHLHRALDFHARRHNVLSSNVANTDTPGFQPLELQRAEQGGFEATLRMAATEQGHIPLGAEGGGDMVVASPERSVRPGLDGNAVSLEREMSKMAANDIRYEGAIKIVSMQLGVLRYAAADGQGR